jgi:protein-tyrosine phosphatase
MKILMVCLGNICRSPLAEGILKHKIREKGLDWFVDSAGTGGWHAGELPDRRSIKIAQKYGIDITDQKARQFKTADLDNFDVVLAMDSANLKDLKSYAKHPQQKEKIQLIMNFARPQSNEEVPDPYYDNRFQLVYELLNEACDGVIERYDD